MLGYNVPVETGIWSAPSQNIGKVKNTGFEMALTYRGNVGDLKYTVTGNIATNKNKVVDLAGSDDIISNGGDKIRFILREGEPIGSFYGYKTDGLYTQEEIDKLVEKSPYYKATSNDVDWLMKVKMQGRIQKWVDHSISVTINLPNDVDEALVNRLYVEAWRSGCKGCTVYRDGSRSGVLLSTQKDKKDKKEELPPCKPPTVVEVRPKVLEAEVVRFQNNKEKWVAFVGLLDGHPYEIFTGLQDDEEGISLPKSVTTGRIIKNIDEEGNKRYDFQFENKRGYKTTIEGLSEKFNKEYWNYAKLISGVLRWRMPIDRVIKLVDSLQLDSENINTWKNGVERALKKYVTDGTSAEGQKCPNCGNETLVYQEGCLICKTCGTSRCG